MGFFRPQDGRRLAGFFSNMVKKWDALTPEEKASGDYINPDEPVVLSVPNPEWTGGDDICDEDDYGNERYLYFHVQSHGGGDDMDEDGNECGHDGAAISGMEIEQPAFFYNGRRAGTVIKYGPAKGRT